MVGPQRTARALWSIAAVFALAGLATAAPALSRSQGASAETTGNLVVNGTFSSATPLGFKSAYKQTTNLDDPQTFTIGLDPAKYNGNWPTIKPHADVGNIMIVNGAITPNKTVWSETISVKPNSSYDFALWIASLYSSPPVLKLEANGSTLGTGSASQTVGAWKKLSMMWQSRSAKSVTLTLVDTNLAFGGNDFALSEIALTGPAAA